MQARGRSGRNAMLCACWRVLYWRVMGAGQWKFWREYIHLDSTRCAGLEQPSAAPPHGEWRRFSPAARQPLRAPSPAHNPMSRRHGASSPISGPLRFRRPARLVRLLRRWGSCSKRLARRDSLLSGPPPGRVFFAMNSHGGNAIGLLPIFPKQSTFAFASAPLHDIASSRLIVVADKCGQRRSA